MLFKIKLWKYFYKNILFKALFYISAILLQYMWEIFLLFLLLCTFPSWTPTKSVCITQNLELRWMNEVEKEKKVTYSHTYIFKCLLDFF